MVTEVAGVSRATVSRVVNGSPKVSPKIVASVTKAIKAIKAINYVPNRAARSLTGRQTQALALVVPEDKTRFFGDPYFAAVVQGSLAASTRVTSRSTCSWPRATRSTRPCVTCARATSTARSSSLTTPATTSWPSLRRPCRWFSAAGRRTRQPGRLLHRHRQRCGRRAGTQRLIDIGRRRNGSIAGAVGASAALRAWRAGSAAAFPHVPEIRGAST